MNLATRRTVVSLGLKAEVAGAIYYDPRRQFMLKRKVVVVSILVVSLLLNVYTTRTLMGVHRVKGFMAEEMIREMGLISTEIDLLLSSGGGSFALARIHGWSVSVSRRAATLTLPPVSPLRQEDFRRLLTLHTILSRTQGMIQTSILKWEESGQLTETLRENVVGIADIYHLFQSGVKAAPQPSFRPGLFYDIGLILSAFQDDDLSRFLISFGPDG